jgi:hypothetical protein
MENNTGFRILCQQLSENNQFKDLAVLSQTSKEYQSLCQTYLDTPLIVKGIPDHLKVLLPTKLSFKQFLAFATYAGFDLDTQKPRKKSEIFLQCLKYSDAPKPESPKEHFFGKDPDSYCQKIYGPQHMEGFDLDQPIKWVYVFGLTYNYEFFDNKIPEDVYNQWPFF